jgi:hypothetical protein
VPRTRRRPGGVRVVAHPLDAVALQLEHEAVLVVVVAADYVVWDEGVAHHWEALWDATVLTVRWPSAAIFPPYEARNGF